MSEDTMNGQTADDQTVATPAAAASSDQQAETEQPAVAPQDASADYGHVNEVVCELKEAPIALFFDTGTGMRINLDQISHIHVTDPQHVDLVYMIGNPKGVPIHSERTALLFEICPMLEGRA